MAAQKITIDALVDAPLDTVWTRYTDPDHITRWNFANDDWCCPSASNDLRVGGRYLARMEARDGSFGFDFGGTYTELTPRESMTYVLDDGRAVTTRFERIGDTTKVTTEFEAEGQNPVEMQRDGWQAILNTFKAHAEAG